MHANDLQWPLPCAYLVPAQSSPVQIQTFSEPGGEEEAARHRVAGRSIDLAGGKSNAHFHYLIIRGPSFLSGALFQPE